MVFEIFKDYYWFDLHEGHEIEDGILKHRIEIRGLETPSYAGMKVMESASAMPLFLYTKDRVLYASSEKAKHSVVWKQGSDRSARTESV